MFLDQETRGCTIYHARPAVCREYPARTRCTYYDMLQFERRQQQDETVVPVVQITFREVKKKTTDNGGADRKSTRLNSSHRCISYAVFCLKKKKEIKKQVMMRDET